MKFATYLRPGSLSAAAAVLAIACSSPVAFASDFSVTPIRAELKPGATSETITVTNHASSRLRVSIKLMEWTQDATGNDVYKDSGDLIYFPRQLDIDPEGKRLVRVGLKTPGGVLERTYRLFIEEEPDPVAASGRAQVALYFRFGVPIFVPPALPKAQPEVLEPTLARGKLSIVVKNAGNQYFRLAKLSFSDDAGWLHDIQGWYSLAGTTRTYSVDIPPQVCLKAKTLNVSLQGEDGSGIRIDRKLNVEPASCQ